MVHLARYSVLDTHTHNVRLCIALYSATELKWRTKKVDFFPRAIDCKASLPFYQAWSRAYKKVGPLQSIASNAEKSAARGAKKGPFCMGILVTLSLSAGNAPRAEKNNFVDKVASECL